MADGFNQVRDRYFAIIGKSAELEACAGKPSKTVDVLSAAASVLKVQHREWRLLRSPMPRSVAVYGLATTAECFEPWRQEQKRQTILPPRRSRVTSSVASHFKGAKLLQVVVSAKCKVVLDAVSADAHGKSAAMVENVVAGRATGMTRRRSSSRPLSLTHSTVTHGGLGLIVSGDQTAVQASAPRHLGLMMRRLIRPS